MKAILGEKEEGGFYTPLFVFVVIQFRLFSVFFGCDHSGKVPDNVDEALTGR